MKLTLSSVSGIVTSNFKSLSVDEEATPLHPLDWGRRGKRGREGEGGGGRGRGRRGKGGRGMGEIQYQQTTN